MNRLKQLLDSESVILLDGAMGTMLMAAGLTSGAPPEEWNVSHPDLGACCAPGLHPGWLAPDTDQHVWL